VEVRRIRPDEHAAAGDVCVAAYDPLLTGAEDDYRERLHDVATRDAQAEVWVATLDDRVVGVVTYCPPGSPWREIGRDDEGEFRMLAVSPAARGAGVGTALTLHCLDRSRELGFRRVVMCSASTMETAHRIYQRLGFTRLPERDWEPVPAVRLLAFTLDL
jgi:ribosomal protein S18 acetylase RimI-like enzyme